MKKVHHFHTNVASIARASKAWDSDADANPLLEQMTSKFIYNVWWCVFRLIWWERVNRWIGQAG